MSSLSTVVTSVKFKILSNQLEDDEFDKFMSTIWRIIGRENVLQLICPPTGNEYISKDELVGIASNIIARRDSHNGRGIEYSTNILRIPRSLIGEVASYLECSDYISFSRANRKLFVDCHSPNKLTKLNLSAFYELDSSFCLSNFSKLTYLDVTLYQMVSLGVLCEPITGYCRHLRTLCICGDTDDKYYDIDMFITHNLQCCGGITTLALYNFQREDSLNPLNFVRLLAEFPALIHLKLVNVYFNGRLNAKVLRSLCPNINQLSLNCVKV